MGETRRQRPSVERLATGGFRPRLCENSNDRRQSINFSLFFGRFPPLQARRSEKVRFRCDVFRQFPSFHTAWVDGGPSRIVQKSAAVGGQRSFAATHRGGGVTPIPAVCLLRVE